MSLIWGPSHTPVVIAETARQAWYEGLGSILGRSSELKKPSLEEVGLPQESPGESGQRNAENPRGMDPLPGREDKGPGGAELYPVRRRQMGTNEAKWGL